MPSAILENRSLISVSGVDAEHFLDNLVTCKVAEISGEEAQFGALLTPQGKILFDFFLMRTDGSYLIDVASSLADEFTRRLTFYRLRAKVDLEPKPEISVVALWDEETEIPDAYRDPRHPSLGFRRYGQLSDAGDADAYVKKRIDCCIAEGDIDFAYGDAYPHEVLMDQFGGVDFKKGCFVGQEVVSRMQHRGTTKKRVLKISSGQTDLVTGIDITADGKPAGKTGSVSGTDGLAILRMDRVQKATNILAGETKLDVALPPWVNFDWPEVKG